MNTVPSWTYEFHGHHCPFMPIGYRMGQLAMQKLGVEREKDHGLFAFPEIGVGHPMTCMVDGIQAATGCTYGKLLMEKTGLGKLAFTLFKPGKGALRIAMKPECMDGMARFEFFKYRKAGKEPSEIPAAVTNEVVEWMFAQPDDALFTVERKADFTFQPVKGSFNKAKCVKCGEYVFERYVRLVNGQPHCLPCAGYAG
ncbi:MAG: FmdE family protein [Candidatus Methylomirabilales bacterium]